jgi:hypothetical protein
MRRRTLALFCSARTAKVELRLLTVVIDEGDFVVAHHPASSVEFDPLDRDK